MSTAERVVEVVDASVNFGALRAVDGVNLTIDRGEIVGLIGPNGAGKSTLVNALSGLVRASGRFVVGGTDVSRMGAHRRVRLGLARTFQQTLLIDDLTVEESMLVAQARGRYWRTPLWREKLTANSRAVLADLGIESFLATPVRSLSYLPRRLTAIAMALATEPLVVMLDEATAGLTGEERATIGALVTHVARQSALGFLVIEHDIEFVSGIADRLVVLHDGAVLHEGDAAEVLSHPEVIASYLGTD
jgi:sulfate-transporting ATPase